ncbi:MAG: hypothetical protein K0R92_3530 [Lachnospiraceae bacterium]|nr:hypothetical protein [Lachnospiraceae bacterium]
MNIINKNRPGLILCTIIAIPSWLLGKTYPIIGGPIIAILVGMMISLFIKDKSRYESGIKFTSKKILQYAVILLGFGLNLSVILETGKQSLPIIISTITTSLVIAYVLHKAMHIPANISTLIGVGSSICGGSAIAATAPVIDAEDEDVAQAISVIFFFNLVANDTSSVTAASSTWDSMYHLGSATIDKAVTVKLTRTLAIIPITLTLAFVRSKKGRNTDGKALNFKKIFPVFIIYFILASVITTIATNSGVSSSIFTPFKELSKFFIILAMAAIGLNTDIMKLVKNGGKPIIMGFCCWIGITIVSLFLQHLLGIW